MKKKPSLISYGLGFLAGTTGIMASCYIYYQLAVLPRWYVVGAACASALFLAVALAVNWRRARKGGASHDEFSEGPPGGLRASCPLSARVLGFLVVGLVLLGLSAFLLVDSRSELGFLVAAMGIGTIVIQVRAIWMRARLPGPGSDRASDNA